MSRIILIGCGRAKQEGRHEAQDLYTGSLFRARRTYAERTGDPWYIISAKYGLVRPEQWIDSYDLTIDQLTPLNRAATYAGIAVQLLTELSDEAVPDDRTLRSIELEIHAGERYAEPLAEVLRAIGMSARTPMKHLSQGEQMRYYAKAKLSGAEVR